MNNANEIVSIKFTEAIENTANLNRILLLGNGFSRSLYEGFNYKNLYESACGLKPGLSSELRDIFTDLDTSDFEKVLAHLNVSEKIIKHYKCQEIYQKISEDLKNIRNSFIESFTYIHPIDQSFISDNTKKNVLCFLANYSQIFTTNYDLLLYWILRYQDDKEHKTFTDNDGFNYPGLPGTPWLDKPIWINHEKQNFYYLHGAFHIFENENIYKLKWDGYDNLVSQISENINNGTYPLIILEGKSSQKIKSINSNPYLWYSYEQLKKINDSIFILGCSLNKHSDQHIVDAIKHSKIKSIYFGVYNNDLDSDLKETLNSFKGHEKKVYLFNSSEAINWEPVS